VSLSRLYTKLTNIDRKLLGLQVVLGLRLGAGAAASGAGAGAPATPKRWLRTGLVVSQPSIIYIFYSSKHDRQEKTEQFKQIINMRCANKQIPRINGAY